MGTLWKANRPIFGQEREVCTSLDTLVKETSIWEGKAGAVWMEVFLS